VVVSRNEVSEVTSNLNHGGEGAPDSVPNGTNIDVGGDGTRVNACGGEVDVPDDVKLSKSTILFSDNIEGFLLVITTGVEVLNVRDVISIGGSGTVTYSTNGHSCGKTIGVGNTVNEVERINTMPIPVVEMEPRETLSRKKSA